MIFKSSVLKWKTCCYGNCVPLNAETFSSFHRVEKNLETRPVLLQSPSYDTVTVQVTLKSIGLLQSYRSQDIHNIARVNFKQDTAKETNADKCEK